MKKLKSLLSIFKSKRFNIQEMLDNPTEEWNEEAKFNRYSIYYRTHGKLDKLEEKDYKVGFGLNHSHYFRVCEIRKQRGLPTRQDYKDVYEHKSRDGGYHITGEKIVSRHHELHDKMLLKKKTGIKYHIDTVSIGYHYGIVVMLVIRAEGSNSHGCLDWDIIKGGDIDTLQRIKENHEEYELIDIEN